MAQKTIKAFNMAIKTQQVALQRLEKYINECK